MLRKIIDCESSEEKLYDGVTFSKLASQQSLDIKRTHHRFLWEYLTKTNRKNRSLKKNIKRILFWRKKSMVDQRLNKAAALSYTTLNLIRQAELLQDLPLEALKVLIYSQVHLLCGGFFSNEIADLELFTAVSLKRIPPQFIGKFSVRYLCQTFSNKLAVLQSAGHENNV